MAAEEVDKEKADGGKKAPPKKAADPKKGSTGRLEDISDNRPRQVNYERNCADEAGGPLEISEDIAKKFSEAWMNVEIIEINKETQEEKVVETLKLDISSLLFPKGEVDVSTKHFY